MFKILWMKKLSLFLALLCLLLPNICFLSGWFHPYIAITLSCLLILSAIIIWHKTKTFYLPTSSALICSRLDVAKLLICLLGALILVETISFHGHFYQPCDFFVRNPIYQSIIDKPWPIYNSDGEYFIYYHAFWLPPALISKYIGNIISPATILFWWAYLFLAVALMLLFCKIKGRVLTFFIIIIILSTVVPDLGNYVIRFSESNFPHFSTWLWEHGFGRDDSMRYVPFWESCRLSFNATLPGFLFLSLLFSGVLPKRYWCIPAAYIVQPALLCAAALFPWLILCLIKERKTFKNILTNIHTWICAILVLLQLVYFSCLENGTSNNGFHVVWAEEGIGDGRTALMRTIHAIILSAPLILSLYYLIEKRYRKNLTFIGGCIIASIIPFVWIGMRNNELLLKGGLVVYFLFSWTLTFQWHHSSKIRKVCISIFLLVSSIHIVREVCVYKSLRDYGWSSEKIERHICDPYKGSIDNMKGYIHNQFFAKNRFPEILSGRK